ncbi:MAG: hypothetical protein ACKVOR_01970 [Flavobacteriales bacterium]
MKKILYSVLILAVAALYISATTTEENTINLFYVDASQTSAKDGLSAAAFTHLKAQVENAKSKGDVFFYGSNSSTPMSASANEKVSETLAKYAQTTPEEPDLSFDVTNMRNEFSYLFHQRKPQHVVLNYYLTDNIAKDAYSTSDFPSNSVFFKLFPKELASFADAITLEVNIIFSNNTTSVDTKRLNEAMNFGLNTNSKLKTIYNTIDL